MERVYFFKEAYVGFMKKLLLVYNPISGARKFINLLVHVVDIFTAAGFLVTVYPTQASGDVENIIIKYADAFDYLVCCGGDGTVNEVINALVPLKKRPMVGFIPAGTVNDFATSLNIPKDIMKAAEVITTATPREFDIGRFANRYFSYVAAFGMFTDVSYTTPQNVKNLLGKLAYFLEGIKRLAAIDVVNCEFTLDDKTICGDFHLGIISNAHSIAGFRLPGEMNVEMDDGFFDVILIQKQNTLKDRQDVIASLLTQEVKTNLLTIQKANTITFKSDTPIAWTLDGDFGGVHTAGGIINHHRALEVLVPT
jgi:YegS/Rv2252/BmrU family lipid kinase